MNPYKYFVMYFEYLFYICFHLIPNLKYHYCTLKVQIISVTTLKMQMFQFNFFDTTAHFDLKILTLLSKKNVFSEMNTYSINMPPRHSLGGPDSINIKKKNQLHDFF
jgi:hypothetical protein